MRKIKPTALVLCLGILLCALTGCGDLEMEPLLGDLDLGKGLLDDWSLDLGVRKQMDVTDLAEYAQARTVTITAEGAGVGTGFFIDDEGTVVTCYHVIDGATGISVKAMDEASYEVKSIVDFNETQDIAVLKVDIAGNDYFKLCQEAPKTGENVYAIGSSLGELEGTFSDGIVSTVSRKIGQINCVQTTAPISSGNSGGPLVNVYGEVIGINAFSYTSGENLNLAVEIGTLEQLAMDKNWSISQFKEWYDKETHRSYFIYSVTEDEFVRSTVHTYQTVTGRECVVSTDGFEEIDLILGDTGYKEGCLVYFYEYHVDEFDAYTQYLNSIGYEYDSREEYDGGTSYFYINEFTACMADILVMSDYVAVSFYSL